jgi:hypothetical protein
VPAYRQEAVVMQEPPMVYEQDDSVYDDESLTYDEDYDVVPQQQLQPVYYEEAPVSPLYEPQVWYIDLTSLETSSIMS